MKLFPMQQPNFLRQRVETPHRELFSIFPVCFVRYDGSKREHEGHQSALGPPAVWGLGPRPGTALGPEEIPSGRQTTTCEQETKEHHFQTMDHAELLLKTEAEATHWRLHWPDLEKGQYWLISKQHSLVLGKQIFWNFLKFFTSQDFGLSQIGKLWTCKLFKIQNVVSGLTF